MRKEIIKHLISAFPSTIDFDYFSLIGESAESLSIPESGIVKFRTISYFLKYLYDEGFIISDIYVDNKNELYYFWNTRLTTDAFYSLEKGDFSLDVKE